MTVAFVLFFGGIGTLVGPEGTFGGGALGVAAGAALCGAETVAEVNLGKGIIDQTTSGPIIDSPDLQPLPPATGTLQEARPVPPPITPPHGPICSTTVCRVVVVTAAGGVITYFYANGSSGAPFKPQPAPPPTTATGK